jgi:hypothetical protein
MVPYVKSFQKLIRISTCHIESKSVCLQLRTFHVSSLDVLRGGAGRPLDALQPVFGRPNKGRLLEPLAGASRQSTAEIARRDPIGRPPVPAGGCITGGATSRAAESKKGERAQSLKLSSRLYQSPQIGIGGRWGRRSVQFRGGPLSWWPRCRPELINCCIMPKSRCSGRSSFWP